MPRFFTGDDLGSVKSINYTRGDTVKDWKAEVKILSSPFNEGNGPIPVQKLSCDEVESRKLLAAARADGSACVYYLSEDERFNVSAEWKETRLKRGQRYVGLTMSDKRIFSCTSNGALRFTALGDDGKAHSAATSVLPMRLCDWRLSSDASTFAYGGDEVELSVWNTEAAFASRDNSAAECDSKKRKRGDQLLPGELWRAKNVANDSLSLRQPVHITSLTYLQPSSSTSHHNLLTGTHQGHVRRYDTRAARRPVADWKGIGKVGGVKAVVKGLAEHEVFVSDNGSNLFAFDLRNGRVAYGYKGISGAVSSMAPSPSLLASVSLDRFLRLHSTCPLPKELGQQQEHKGEVLDKLYMKTIPTVVVWDSTEDPAAKSSAADADEADDEADEDNVWDAMENAEGEDAEDSKGRQKIKTAK